MLVAFSVAPSGTGREDGSVSDAVAAAVAVVRASGLPHRTDAMFTTIEGEWDECFAVVRAATDAVAAFGSRVSLVLKADIRPGFTGELDAKLARLEAHLDAQD
ncbi:thiamine-binding protein [Nocardioides sp. AE5]|uniref:thiamine-binding protein n=1 Tax=Nocardioides sp. AE5 TaxID=2962573 RepID=UPI0028812D7B|nr:thiamine-binding protein [Nocardioides sp. AE5]MDT0201395.1 thiamine-binding protein [Nocardioides sp. AE5]